MDNAYSQGVVEVKSDKLLRGYASGTSVTYTFVLPLNSPGISNLPQSLTINSIEQSADLILRGQDANASTWTALVGDDFTKVGTGSTGFAVDQNVPWGSTDKAVRSGIGGTVCYQCDSSSVADVTTEDFVVVLAWKDRSGTGRVFSKEDTSNGFQGYGAFPAASSIFAIIRDSSSNVQINALSSTVGIWRMAMVVFDRSGFGQWHMDGVSSGLAGNISSYSATSITSDDPLTVFALPNQSSHIDEDLAYLAVFKRGSWVDSHVQNDVARELASRLYGTYPTTADAYNPAYSQRGSTAFSDRVISGTKTLFLMGNHAARVCERSEMTGYLIEPAAQQLLLQSRDLTTTWAKENAGDTIAKNALGAPDGTTTMSSITADATDTQHGVSQAVTLTAATYCFSVVASAGDRDWIQLVNSTVASCNAYFDLSTGQVGTVGAGCTAGIESWGSDRYLCYIRFTGTAASHTLILRGANGDGDNDWSGDGSTVSSYFWEPMCAAEDYPSSRISTTTGAVTRNKDYTRYAGNDNLPDSGSPTSIEVQADILIGSIPAASVLERGIVCLTDGFSALDRIYLNVQAGSGVVQAQVAATAGNAGTVTGTTNVCDGAKHTVKLELATDSLRLYVDDIEEGTEDTSVTVPNDLDHIMIGSDHAANNMLGGMISDVKISAGST